MIIVGGAACVFIVACLAVILWPDSDSKSVLSSPTVSSSPAKNVHPDRNQDTSVAHNLPTPAEDQVSLVPTPKGTPPLPDEETHKKIVAALNERMRGETKKLFGGFFQQQGLSASAQDKVIDILTQQEKQMQQQAFEATKSGAVPTPPSLDEMRTQRAQQDQQLRAVLGDNGFTQFNQYRTTIPDRLIINSMSQEGANLTDSQSEQLLQVLTQARQEIVGQSGISNLNSMSQDQVIATMEQQQLLLQQTVNNRIQNILTAEQKAVLQHTLSQRAIAPKGP